MLYNDDCLNILKQLEPNSIDSIITDPPYGYSFMNKDWDKVVVGVDTWKECLRVLKPGSFAAIMSSPRQDVLSRIIVNLQDAGFETGFTSIYWTYACLSEDTEIFTKDGWEHYHNTNKFKAKEILCYSIENDQYFFESPKEWKIYNQIEDTLYRIKSDYTDQLVTRNHRCIIERKGKLLFQYAENLGQTVDMPYLDTLSSLSMSLSNVSCNDKEKGKNSDGNLLFNKLQTESGYQKISSSEWETYSPNVRTTKTKTKRSNDGRKESGLEGWSNIFQNSWKLYRSQIYQMSEGIYNYGSERWLCNGASNIGCKGIGTTIIENRGSTSYRSQSYQQQLEQSNAFFEQPTSQEIRALSKSYRTTLATVDREYYEGLVFCPVVSTGCFIARRNGKIFITGNSGFPKAANVPKLVDKRNGKIHRDIELEQYISDKIKQKYKSHYDLASEMQIAESLIRHWIGKCGDQYLIPTIKQYNILKQKLDLDTRFDDLIKWEKAEREIIGKGQAGLGKNIPAHEGGYKSNYNVTKSLTETAKKLDGSYAGLQVKPAVEIILMVMKPLSEKSYVDQALSNGKGVTWLDDCRIPYQNDDDKDNTITGFNKSNSKSYNPNNGWNNNNITSFESNMTLKGRFPANLLVSDDVLNDCKITTSKKGIIKEGYVRFNGVYNNGKRYINTITKITGYNDSGSFSRYFDLDKWFETTFPFIITPKPSPAEKNRGLDKWIKQKVNDGRQTPIDNPFQRGETLRKNIHPTVKPIKLMSYLITMLTRKKDIVLDPFMGSGSTIIAALLLDRNYIGIELDKDYFDISNTRIDITKKELIKNKGYSWDF